MKQIKNVPLKDLNARTLNLLELLNFAANGNLVNWKHTIRLAVRQLAKEELEKYEQAMDALAYISLHADEMSTELNPSTCRDMMRSFVKIADAVLSTESDELVGIKNS